MDETMVIRATAQPPTTEGFVPVLMPPKNDEEMSNTSLLIRLSLLEQIQWIAEQPSSRAAGYGSRNALICEAVRFFIEEYEKQKKLTVGRAPLKRGAKLGPRVKSR